jgi:hypothetical protein
MFVGKYSLCVQEFEGGLFYRIALQARYRGASRHLRHTHVAVVSLVFALVFSIPKERFSKIFLVINIEHQLVRTVALYITQTKPPAAKRRTK